MTLQDKPGAGPAGRSADAAGADTPLLDTSEAYAAADPVAETTSRRFTLGIDRFSGVYVLVALIVLFGVWVPNTFLSSLTLKSVLGGSAVEAIVALGLLVPVACGCFDLSISGTVSITACTTVWLQTKGLGIGLSIVIAILLGVVVGLVNSTLIVRLNVDSFIGTLGMNSVLAAGAYWVTGGFTIPTGTGGTLAHAFSNIGQYQIGQLPLPFYYLVVLAAVLYWLLEYSPAGRYLYAVGANPAAARLAGVRVDRLRVAAFVTSGVVAAFAGVVYAAQLGAVQSTSGDAFLLPAFSAVFLGATQFRPGRVNVLGALLATYLVATGVKGLQLAGAQPWAQDLFNGAALIIAVALAARSSQRKTA